MLARSARRRPDIWLGVERLAGERIKREALVDRVLASPGPGVVYAATSRHGEDLAEALARRGIRTGAYHGELKRDERSALHDAFAGGAVDVIVATSALGSDLPRSQITFVFHYDLSASLAAYYDEIQQAGDHAESARAVLFYSPEDVSIRRFLAESGKLDRDDIERVAQAISETDEPIGLKLLRARTGLSQAKVTRAVARLEEVNVAETLPTGEIVALDGAPNLSDAVEVAARSHERRREADQERVEPMRAYAELSSCRRAYILKHLGESFEAPCNCCDVCETPPGSPRALRPQAARGSGRADPFPIDSHVRHKLWGVGTVAAYEGDGRSTVVVRFERHGARRLSVEVVRREGLLAAAD